MEPLNRVVCASPVTAETVPQIQWLLTTQSISVLEVRSWTWPLPPEAKSRCGRVCLPARAQGEKYLLPFPASGGHHRWCRQRGASAPALGSPLATGLWEHLRATLASFSRGLCGFWGIVLPASGDLELPCPAEMTSPCSLPLGRWPIGDEGSSRRRRGPSPVGAAGRVWKLPAIQPSCSSYPVPPGSLATREPARKAGSWPPRVPDLRFHRS